MVFPLRAEVGRRETVLQSEESACGAPAFASLLDMLHVFSHNHAMRTANFATIFFALLATALLPACSVFMAASGERTPRLDLLGSGQNRSLVESELGRSRGNASLPGGARLFAYRYVRGEDPSYGRALGHLALDALTLGASEVVTTPLEALRGERYELPVLFDANDAVIQMFPSRRLGHASLKRKETREREERLRTMDKTPVIEVGVFRGYLKQDESRALALFDANKKILSRAGVGAGLRGESLDERRRASELAERCLAPNSQTLDLGRRFDEERYVVVILGELLTPRRNSPEAGSGPAALHVPEALPNSAVERSAGRD